MTLSLLCGLVACASTSPMPDGPPIPSAQSSTPPAPAAEDGPLTLARHDVDAALKDGPPWILRRVPTAEVMDNNKFVGWRIQSLPEGWDRVELIPGDVITKVNSLPLDTPDRFFKAWTSLTAAKELRVDYLRDGQSRTMRVPIVGEADPTVARTLNEEPSKPAGPQPVPGDGTLVGKGKRSKTIKPPERPLSNTLVD